MPSPKALDTHKVLLVDDDDGVRQMMTARLEHQGFQVVSAASVVEALRFISSDTFDVLLTDLNMPNAGDGFTVVSAMRHSQPDALIILISGYPDVDRAMATIAMEADEIVTKPFDVTTLFELIGAKLLGRKRAIPVDKERVGAILDRCTPDILKEWLSRAKESSALNHLRLSDEERTGHLPKLVGDLVARLGKASGTMLTSEALLSESASDHGKLRYLQGYNAPMLVHESRILQVTLFGTLQNNLNCLDFSLLLPDVMRIADEVDAQLTQTMASFVSASQASAAA